MKVVETETGRLKIECRWNKEANKIQCHSVEEFNAIVKRLVDEWKGGWVNIRNGFNCSLGEGMPKSLKSDIGTWRSKDAESKVQWSMDKKNSIFVVLWADSAEEMKCWWVTMTTNMMKGQEMTGSEAIAAFNEALEEGTGKTLEQHIGSIHGSDIGTNDVSELDAATRANFNKEERMMVAFKKMMPPRLQWISTELVGSELECYNKADFSSAYPSNARRLPTWEGHKEIMCNGFTWEDFQKPQYQEFDYAFCLNSGKVFIRSEGFNSEEVAKSPMWSYINKSEEVATKECCWEKVVLCKDSGIDFFPYWNKFYQARKDDSNAKTVMVAAIGTFESCQFRYAQHFKGFAALVIYWRHIKKMATLFERLVERGQVPIQFAIDSIGWLGEPQPDLCDEVKRLGGLNQEFANAKVCLKANGVYAVEQDGKITVRAQGTHLPEDIRLKKIEDIMSLKTYTIKKKVVREENIVEYYTLERVGVLSEGNRVFLEVEL